MANLTSLLDQMGADHSDAPQTLADTLRKHARSYTDADLLQLVEGMRAQSARWSAEQAAGSGKRVTSKQIPVAPKPALAGFSIKSRPIL